MSETDWATAGCPVGKPNRALFTAIDKVEALLQPYGGPLWPQLIKTAHMLIVVARTAAGNVMLIAKSRKPSRCLTPAARLFGGYARGPAPEPEINKHQRRHKMKYTLTITPNAGGKDIELIKELRDLTGKGLKECVELVTTRKPFVVVVEDHEDSPFRKRQPEHFANGGLAGGNGNSSIRRCR
jgi:ribosomal protein L7/L12